LGIWHKYYLSVNRVLPTKIGDLANSGTT
jgi:hypothetical protein